VGIAKFHKLSHILGLEIRSLRDIMETVDCLNLLSHKVLIHSGHEIREFGAFSRWLRHEIDVQGTDPLSATMEELAEKSDTIDYSEALSYIQGALTKSALDDYIQSPAKQSPTSPPASPGRWDTAGADSSFYETYKRLLRQQDQQRDQATDNKVNLPLFGDLTTRLGSQCEKVFSQIAETQRRGILHRSPLFLDSDCDSNTMDMTMDFEVRYIGLFSSPRLIVLG
jgi:anaphase-promoting complex subunit 4